MSTGPGAERFDERRLLVALFGAGIAAFAQLYALVVSLAFLAYLAGTWSSARTGRLVVRHRRRRVLIVSTGVLAVGTVSTLSGWLLLILAGLVVLTAGFFGAHEVASGWTRIAAPRARRRAIPHGAT